MKPLNVLVTAASRRVPLVNAFRSALARQGGGRVVVTDVNALSPAVYSGDRAYRVPLTSDPGYLDELLAICRAERIGMLIPTIDDELPIFSAAVARFAEQGVRVIVSPTVTTTLCNDKYATCRMLRERGIPAAESFLRSDLPADPPFPMFIKPNFGRGSVGAVIVRNRRELEFFVDYVDGPVIQEYLDGPEFTIDVLCDFSGRPLSIVPRERVVVRAGVIDRGRTVNDPALIELARACASVLAFAGPINIQCRVHDGRPTVFEINPRFSGGIPLTIEAGADFPAMLLQLHAGRRVTPSIGQFRDQLWMTNYEASVFLDASRVQLEPLGAAAPAERGVA
ncbi:MAG: ATP-grasp domain-containing protein [Vicinamibacterales bacterium]